MDKLRTVGHNFDLISERIPEASVLFVDIVNYVSLAQDPVDSNSRRRSVVLINKIFAQMDILIAESAGVEKVKTVNTKMMIVGGLVKHKGELPHEHLKNIIQLALQMRDLFSRVELHDENGMMNLDLDLCFGIECGSVVAGIVGEKCLGFDVFGDTVNTASR